MANPDPTAAAPGSSELEAFGYRQELRRSLRLRDLLVFGLILIAPIAPFSVFGVVFNASRGMVPCIYLVGLVAMLFTALSYMAMSEVFPVAGSVDSYASRSMGEAAGFLAGWLILLDYLLVPTLIYVTCAIALHAAWPQIPKPFAVVLFLSFSTAEASRVRLGCNPLPSVNKTAYEPRKPRINFSHFFRKASISPSPKTRFKVAMPVGSCPAAATNWW